MAWVNCALLPASVLQFFTPDQKSEKAFANAHYSNPFRLFESLLTFALVSVYHDRMRLNAQNQRDWADQQVREHRAQAAADAEEESNWAAQEEAILRMRGMLEDENAARKAAYHR